MRRMFVVKRQDLDQPLDTVTTLFQLDIQRRDGKEDIRSAVLFNEVVGEAVSKEAKS